MPCVLKLIDSDKRKYDINIEFDKPYKIYNGYNKVFKEGILSNFMLSLDDYKGAYDKKDILSVEICDCIKEVPENIPYKIANAKGLIIPSSISAKNFNPKALVNLQGTALECVCIENNPGVEKSLRDSFPNLKIFHKRDEYNAFLFNEQTLQPAYLEVKDVDNKIHKLEIYDDDFKDEESNYIFPRLRHLHAFKIGDIFKRNGLNPEDIKVIDCHNIRILGALCFNKFENLISVGADRNLDDIHFSPFPDCLIGLKLPSNMYFGFYKRENNNNNIFKKIKCVLVEKGSKIEQYVSDNFPNLKIFYDENQYDKFIQEQSQKAFIKIKDTNGKIYEHEIEFADHTKEINHKSSKEHSKEEKYLSESMVEQILQKLKLDKEDVLEVEIFNTKILGFRALSNYYINMEKIILHDGLEIMENGSLFGCSALKSLYIPKTVKKVGVNAASFCTSLEDLVINKNARIYKTSFMEVNNLKTITIIENPEAEKIIKQAMEKGFISKNVKIFHSLKERDDFYRDSKNENPEVYVNHNSDESISSVETEASDSENHNSKPKQKINNQETKIQKQSYSELLSWKLLIPLWFFYKLICICICISKQNETPKKPLSNTKAFDKQNKFHLLINKQNDKIPHMQKNNHESKFIGF